jgi:hypothetical protein
MFRQCSTFTGLWYGQEKLVYPALLILLECYALNTCAADISLKVTSLQLKGGSSTELQFHMARILLRGHPHNLLSLC